MNNILEIHILQNFVPSNLNRDDTGSPKDCHFGGYLRGRISSQCLKRAARTYVRESGLLSDKDMATRTQRLTTALTESLVTMGHDAEESKAVAEVALAGLKLSVAEDKTQYLLYIGQNEVDNIANVINDHWEALHNIAQSQQEAEEGKKKKGKKDAKAELDKADKGIVKALEASLDGGKAVDLALFGRMLADLPTKNRDASCQVAHAISTNTISREFDFFTAVDDLQPEDNSGAGMLGTVEFNSACYYRYAVIDINKLSENLEGDVELCLKGIDAFLKAIYFAEPSGKQNSFAAHNPPSFMALSLRQGATPRNLANAFEKPISKSAKKSLTEASIEALDATWKRFDEVLGSGESSTLAAINITDAELDYLKTSSNLEDAFTTILDAVEASLKA